MSQRNASPLSYTFNANSAGTPTKVFDASVTWPLKSANPTGTGPAKWVSSLAYPFSASWPYDGKSGLILDYLFTGGVVPSMGYYYLDASDMPSYGYDRTALSLGVNSCVDYTMRGYSTPGTFRFGASTFAHDYIAPTSFSNMVKVGGVLSKWTAPNAPVVHVYSARGNVIGVPFPAATCGLLHIDLSIPPIVLVLKASGDGIAYVDNLVSVPYSPAYAGIQLYGQAAWGDSLGGNLLLTNGYRVTIPSQPPDRKRCMLYRPYGPFTTARAIERDHHYNPIPLYTYQ